MLQLPALRELRCRGCEGIDDDAMVALRDNTTLRTLDLSGTCVTAAGLTSVHLALPALTCVGLAGCQVTDATVRSLAQLRGASRVSEGQSTVRFTSSHETACAPEYARTRQCVGRA